MWGEERLAAMNKQQILPAAVCQDYEIPQICKQVGKQIVFNFAGMCTHTQRKGNEKPNGFKLNINTLRRS